MQNITLITGYKNPDLDTYACVYAYSEFFKKTRKNVIGAVSGIIHREAEFVVDKFNINKLKDLQSVSKYDEVILVDTDYVSGISDDKIVEVVDHRKVHEADRLKNLKRKQIELVGACATLIAEKFYREKINPSKESAVLLYSAIVSNTINFQGKVTTSRDRKMFKWLEEFINVEKGYIEEMFQAKSDLGNRSLKEILREDWKILEINQNKVCIIQLEIIEVNKFLGERQKEIEGVMRTYGEEYNFDYIFFTVIDILKGFNKIIVIDSKSKEMLRNSLRLEFEKNTAQTDSVLMRKEIIPEIKSYLEEEK